MIARGFEGAAVAVLRDYLDWDRRAGECGMQAEDFGHYFRSYISSPTAVRCRTPQEEAARLKYEARDAESARARLAGSSRQVAP